jgi:hypothetical protein
MFASVLKNVILSIMIVLIIHLMLLNYKKEFEDGSINISNTNISPKKYKPSTLKIKPIVESEFETLDQPEPLYQPVRLDEPEIDDTLDKYNKGEALENATKLFDLYDFVYDDKNTDEQLDVFFSEKNNVEEDLRYFCDDQTISGTSKNFCSNEIDEFLQKRRMTLESEKGEKENNFTKEGKHPILFEYKEEVKHTNDFKEVDGFESFGSSFMTL